MPLVQFALTQADRGVERDEATEADVEGRHGRPWPQRAVLFFKDLDDVRSHLFGG